MSRSIHGLVEMHPKSNQYVEMTVNDNSIFEYYSLVKTKKINWLWYPYIPFGKLTIVQGDPGDGKSTFVLDIIARLTNGTEMPDGYKINSAYNVVYQCFEDDVSDTIKPRLESAGANCSKVAYIRDNNNSLNLDDKRIEATIKQTNAKLLVLDPIQSFLQDSDLNSAGRIRSILSNLVRIAKVYDCAIILIGHLNKSNSAKNIYRGLGSIDITAISRSVLMIERDEENPQIRYIYPIKSSLALEGDPLEFQIINKKIKWLGRRSAYKNIPCKDILIDILRKGATPSSIVLDLAKNGGYSERTINTEKKKLGIISFRKNGKWFWKLPDELISLEVQNG